METVYLYATNDGLSTNSIYLSGGVGTKTVSIDTPGAGVKITASGEGMSGESNAFNVGSACTSSIGGTVKRDTALLEGATVYLDGDSGSFTTTSGVNGKYSFDNIPIPSGSYTLQAEYSDGGKSDDIPVYIPCGCISRDIKLYPACNPTGKTPVLLVPGIMGSTLKEHQFIPTLSNNGFIDPSKMELYDGLATYNGWDIMRGILKNFGYEEGCTIFDVPYDWRLDVRDVVNKYLIPAINKAKQAAGTTKVNIIAHSMGGLVVREYIQGSYYQDDIDRFAMIGTPNHGSGNAYPLWEGGDPFTADIIAMNELPVYTLATVYLVKGPDVAEWAENFLKDLKEGDVCKSILGELNWLCIVKNIMWLYKDVATYIYKNVPSLGQLMPTYTMLDRITGPDEKVECLSNDWLDGLNNATNISRFTYYNDNDPSKVRTMLFIGDNEDTVLKLSVTPKHCSLLSGYYPDGNIFWFDREPQGDGTVLKSSAKLDEATVSYGPYKTGEHAKLIAAFAPEVFDFINGGDGIVSTQSLEALARIRADAAITKSLSIATTGTVRPLITTPSGQKIGIENGQFVNQVPERTDVNIGVDSGVINIESTADGTYTVTLADTVARDYTITIRFSDSAGSKDVFSARGFNHAGSISFTFNLVSTSSENQLIINHTPSQPTGLQADAVDSDGLKTRLTWDLSTDSNVDHYNIYAKDIDEPYLTQIGTSSTNSYDTGEPWAINSSIKTRVYAVSAVKGDGTESFLSDMVQNNDRDHDGLSDEEEAGFGSDPDNPDSDGDGLSDGEEYLFSTDLLLTDTDGDGFNDYTEVQVGSDPLDSNSTPQSLTITECQVTMDADKNCTAAFDVVNNNQYTKLTLLSPNGGEVLPSGSTYTIQWGAPSNVVKFKLKYSLNNGRTWKLIGKNLTGTSYDWQVPTPPKNKKKCLIKVIGYDANGNKVGVDVSDAPFTVEVVKLESPDGGETLNSGQTVTITWSTNSTKLPVKKAKLYYSIDGGLNWIYIGKDQTNSGSYDWTVPNVKKNRLHCRVRVDLIAAGGVLVGRDISDGEFEIKVLDVTAPTNGDSITAGDILNITWQTYTEYSVSKVIIKYTKNGGRVWKVIKTLTGNPGSYSWTVPQIKRSKSHCKVKVILKNADGITIGKAVSSGYFSILTP